MTTENVLGSELRAGDLIWNGGYLWRVLETKHEVYTLIHSEEVRRWVVTCEWSGIGTDPKFFNDNAGFARREDLMWPRCLSVPAKKNVCEGCGDTGEVQVDTAPNGAWIMEPCPLCGGRPHNATTVAPSPVPGSDATTADGRFIGGPGYGGERM